MASPWPGSHPARAGAEFTLLRKPYNASNLNRAFVDLHSSRQVLRGDSKVVEFADRRKAKDRRS